MKVKMSIVVLLTLMLLTSYLTSSQFVHAKNDTSTGKTSILAGGNVTVAIKDNGEVYVWGEGVSGEYAIIDVSKGFDSVSPDYKRFYKDVSRPYFRIKNSVVIDCAPHSESVDFGNGTTLSVSFDGSITLHGEEKSEKVRIIENYYIPNEILTNVIEVSEGQNSSVGINNDGSIIAWGKNDFWQLTNARNLSHVKAVAAGSSHLVFLREDGTVVVTGYNYYNQGKVPKGLKNVKDIAAGDYHTVALKEDGTVVVWGANNYGQCDVPQGLDRVISIAAGKNHTVALRDDGTIVAWGYNFYKQCNVPEGFKWLQVENPVNTDPYLSPTPTSDSTKVPTPTPSVNNVRFKKVFGGEDSLWGITKDGQYSYWGSLHGIDNITPLFPGLQNAKAVAVGYYHCAVLDENGRVYMSGTNTTGANEPEDLTNIKSIACGTRFTAAVKEDGTVLVWGDNYNGQCNVPSNLGRVKEIACGYDFVLALREDGTLAAWGGNEYDECNIPGGLKDIKSVAASGRHSLALKSNGTVISIGDDWGGAFDVPQGLTDVKAIACSYFHNIALKEDGTVVVWGLNINTAPKELKNVKQIVAGYSYVMAICEDGSTVKWEATNSVVNALPDTLIIEDSEKEMLFGDLNLDGIVNSIDLALLRKHLLGLKDSLPDMNGIGAADLNGDGSINSIDFALLRKYILGMIYEFSVSQMN